MAAAEEGTCTTMVAALNQEEEAEDAKPKGGDDGEDEKPPTMVPMPLSTIAAILSLKREPMPTPEGLAYLSPEERDERLAFYDSWKEFDDEFEEFQKEIIRELKETGRYMVDESYFTKQAERRARMEKEWAKLDWTGAKFVVATGVKCADAADGEVEEKPPTMVPMPLSTIAAILSLKREPMPTPKGLAYLSPEERNERLAFYDSWKEFDDEFEEFQKEIIRELKETGRYMVDESYFTEQAERRARMEKEWAKLDWTGAKFGDWDYDDPTCCQRL
uniref:Uncharacterized protein n=1 Tax=Oryza punctata TaxID=4537 RepID=A0A0E0MH10_ORYPU